LFSKLNIDDQFNILTNNDRTSFGNAIPGKAKFFTVDFTGDFETSFGVAIKIAGDTAMLNS
jgi:hypothetical protein